MKLKSTLAGLACVAALAAATPAQATESDHLKPTGLTAAEGRAVAKHLEKNPLDLAGAEELVLKAGGDPLSVSLNGVDHPVSAQEANEISRARNEAFERQQSQSGDPEPSLMAVPIDAFDVAATFVPIGTHTWVAHGTWNFRDNYVGTGDPDNIAALHVSKQCIELGEIRHGSFRYDGTKTNASYLRDAGLSTNTPVVGVRDRTFNHMSNSDNGFVQADLIGRCGPTDWKTQFTYEHNQGGGDVLGVSAGWGFLNVSYGGSPMTLQKSTQVVIR